MVVLTGGEGGRWEAADKLKKQNSWRWDDRRSSADEGWMDRG